MASGYTIGRRNRRVSWAIAGGGIALAVLVAWLAQSLAASRALEQVRAEAQESLALQVEVLNGLLEKYRLMPPLLAKRSDIVALFATGGSDAAVAASATAKAVEIAALSGAKDVAFADARGRVFASARNELMPHELLDQQIFAAARQGRLGREVILSSASDRSYVFTSAVREAETIIGFIAVFVRFDQSEAAWSLSLNPIVVTRGDGTIFLSNRPDWLLRPLFGDSRNAVMAQRGGDVVEVAGNPAGLRYQASRFLPLLGWTLHVFADYRPVVDASRQAILLAAMTAALLTGGLWIVAGRRAAALARQRRDQAASLRLERLVRDRTAKLTAANVDLAHEVDERRQTEDKLRMTQSELVQAAKLAAIGQMSTALSHEYNQPLGAIRTYADNARQFLARGKPDQAGEALGRIGDMVDRISALSKTLLGFARKPGTALYPVPVGAIADEALMLAGPRAKKLGIVIDRSGLEDGLWAMAGKVRLTQVLVNLVINAIDALAGVGSERAVAHGTIVIGAQRTGDEVTLWVEDNGPGIAPEKRAEVFEPFYSSKGVGEGLGIGLSIVYSMVKDLGGTIVIEDGTLGGARFVVTLAASGGDEPAAAREREELV
ncbi:MAG: sensor histidine kinase [Brucellaceae bacterium]|nr:sensor histidine kinase [Brucellaceae bacterium]